MSRPNCSRTHSRKPGRCFCVLGDPPLDRNGLLDGATGRAASALSVGLAGSQLGALGADGAEMTSSLALEQTMFRSGFRGLDGGFGQGGLHFAEIAGLATALDDGSGDRGGRDQFPGAHRFDDALGGGHRDRVAFGAADQLIGAGSGSRRKRGGRHIPQLQVQSRMANKLPTSSWRCLRTCSRRSCFRDGKEGKGSEDRSSARRLQRPNLKREAESSSHCPHQKSKPKSTHQVGALAQDAAPVRASSACTTAAAARSATTNRATRVAMRGVIFTLCPESQSAGMR